MKQLRSKNNITQERLAEYLYVSPQAISRWETGNSFPDISLIAPICNIFGITSDELLGIDAKNRNLAIQGYMEAFNAWAAAPEKTEELRQNTIDTLRKGLRLYPDSLPLKKQLINVLYMNSEIESEIDEKREMCKLCKEIIDGNAEDEEKYRYISMFCEYARVCGLSEEGEKFAAELPDSQYYKQRCLALCKNDIEARKKLINEYIFAGWAVLKDAMNLLITEVELSPKEIAQTRQKLEEINAVLFDNDDIVLKKDLDEFKAAQAFYKAGDYDNAIKYLKISLRKWTDNAKTEKVSPMRGDIKRSSRDNDEIRAEARGFIKLVNSRFKNILSDERIVALLNEAKSIA